MKTWGEIAAMTHDGSARENGMTPGDVAAAACRHWCRVWRFPSGTLVQVWPAGGARFIVYAQWTTGELYQSGPASLRDCYHWVYSTAREERAAWF